MCDCISICVTLTDCLALDAVCQESLTSLSVAWQPFIDKESGIIEYVPVIYILMLSFLVLYIYNKIKGAR